MAQRHPLKAEPVTPHSVPLTGLGLVSVVIWLSEIAARFFNAWLYPDQINGW